MSRGMLPAKSVDRNDKKQMNQAGRAVESGSP